MTETETKAETPTPTQYLDGFKILGPYPPHFEKEDDRKRKVYGAKVTFAFDVIDFETAGRGGGQHRARKRPYEQALRERFLPDVLRTGTRLRAVNAGLDWFRGTFLGGSALLTDEENRIKSLESIRVSVTFFIEADKPSAIVSNKELALSQLMKHEFDPSVEILATIKRQLTAAIEDEAREERRAQASMFAGKLARTADKNAREIVRFEQRLAALVAELKAEQGVQLAKLCTSAQRNVEEQALVFKAEKEGDEPIRVQLDPRSVAAGIKHAVEMLPEADPESRGLGFSERTTKIADEEVK